MLPLASTGLGVWWGVGLWGIEVTYCRVLLMHMRATGASAHWGTNESSRGCRSEKEGGKKHQTVLSVDFSGRRRAKRATVHVGLKGCVLGLRAPTPTRPPPGGSLEGKSRLARLSRSQAAGIIGQSGMNETFSARPSRHTKRPASLAGGEREREKKMKAFEEFLASALSTDRLPSDKNTPKCW